MGRQRMVIKGGSSGLNVRMWKGAKPSVRQEGNLARWLAAIGQIGARWAADQPRAATPEISALWAIA